MEQKQQHKILLTGGGSGGPVSPLLAIVDEFRRISAPGEYDFLWIGTRTGIEIDMVKRAGIAYRAIAAGKLRRYFSLSNLIDIFRIAAGFCQATAIILKWRPEIILSAGGFVSVPVAWAGWLTRVPVLIHQQDVRPGLANKLMAPVSRVVTVTFEKSLADYGPKARLVGNPVRQEFQAIAKLPAATKKQPTVLVLGGGTGAAGINQLVWNSLDKLAGFCRIIHLTGREKGLTAGPEQGSNNYVQHEFFDTKQMAEAYAQADLVVSRCGLSVLTELSCLGKPAILIPMPKSHQEDNAQVFKEAEAAVVLPQNELTPDLFAKIIKKLLTDKTELAKLSANISGVIRPGAQQTIVKIIKEIIN